MNANELVIQPNTRTGGEYCIFQHNDVWYVADRSWVFDYKCYETMIFVYDNDEKKCMFDLGECYCDRTEKPLRDCIMEFIKEDCSNEENNV